MAAGSALYDMSGMTGPSVRTVSAPVAKGSIIRSRSEVAPKTVMTGVDTVTVRGRAEIMRLEVGTAGYYVYDVNSNWVAINEGNAVMPLTMSPPGAGAMGVPLATQSGYLAAFTTPVRLRNLAQLYSLWRYENIRFTFVPVVSTSLSGSVSMAWTRESSMYINNASSFDLWGASPGDPMTMSQLTHFVQTPVWQTTSLDVRPRLHGVAEDKKSWLSTSFQNSNSNAALGNTLDLPFQCGSFILNMSDFATPLSAYTAGYILMDYEVSYHESSPLKSLSLIYNVSDFLYEPCNKDILEDLLDRRRQEIKRCEGRDVARIDEYRKHLCSQMPVVVTAPVPASRPSSPAMPVPSPLTRR